MQLRAPDVDMWGMKSGSNEALDFAHGRTVTRTLTGDNAVSPLVPETRSLEGLDVVGVLGDGGMGVVHDAVQLSVDRPVAVKTLHLGDHSETHQAQLVSEGWVLGLLEHPNIVPIYTLTNYGDSPAIVTKRIEGETWESYFRYPEMMDAFSNEERELEWHLGVLLKVVDAVRFAHSRGVVHRDLKPANVMIGEFGEVYVMDWGLAVSMRPEHNGKMQLASDVYRTSGTYSYLAPEMLEPQVTPISERTDVYQLGGMLYEICMRRPPHVGDDSYDVEERIRRSSPPFRNGLPRELVAICLRAMRPRPEDRFGTADDFRCALLDYLRHRGSARIRDKGELLLEALVEMLEDGSDERREVYTLLDSSRFAFQQALESWPDDPEARAGLCQCAQVGAEYELAVGEPELALTLLDGFDETDLVRRCEEAIATKRMRQQEAESLRIRSSRVVDAGGRRLAIGGIAAGWAFLPLMLQLLLPSTTYATQASTQFGFLSLWLLVGVHGGWWVSSTELNLRSYSMVLAATLLALVIKLGSFTMGVSAASAQVYDLFVFFTAGLLTSFLIEWRMWPTALAYLAAFIFSSLHPGQSLWAMAASNAVLAATVLSIWREEAN